MGCVTCSANAEPLLRRRNQVSFAGPAGWRGFSGQAQLAGDLVGRLHLDLASGWQLAIEIERDQLGALLWALAPDGRDWVYGCQRDDWSLGPDSRIVEPLELLTAAQRLELEGLLRQACCWPPPLASSDWLVPPDSRLCTHRQRRQRRRPSQIYVRPFLH